jgi:uncharacterized protein (DUF3084 family)
MPDPIIIHIKNLQGKLQVLLKKHASLLKENAQLKAENEQCHSGHEELKRKAELLEQRVQILQSSAGKLEGREKADFEKRINRYIKSLDKCISILNE